MLDYWPHKDDSSADDEEEDKRFSIKNLCLEFVGEAIAQIVAPIAIVLLVFWLAIGRLFVARATSR